MGRGRKIVDPWDVHIRIDAAFDEAIRLKLVEFCELPAMFPLEVVVCAEIGQVSKKEHYHLCGITEWSAYTIKEEIKQRFQVQDSSFCIGKCQKSKGGYEGMQRYTCKGNDHVYSKGIDYAERHREYWKVNREQRKKQQEELSIRQRTFNKFCKPDDFGNIRRVDPREVITFMAKEYVRLQRPTNRYEILGVTRTIINHDQSSLDVWVDHMAQQV